MAGKAFLHKKSLIDKFRDEHSKGTGYIQSARARRTWNNPITRRKRTNKLNDWVNSFAGRRHIRKLSRFNALKESNANNYEDYSGLKLGETYRLSKGKAIVNRLNKLLAGIGGIVEYASDLNGGCKIYFRGYEATLHTVIKSKEWNKVISEMDSISNYTPKFDIVAVKDAAYKLRQKYSDTGDGAGVYAIDRMLNRCDYRELHDMLVNHGYLDKSESFNKPKVTLEMLLAVLNYYKQNYRWSDELVSKERENTFEWLETYASVFVPAYTESGVEAGLQAISDAEETGVCNAEIFEKITHEKGHKNSNGEDAPWVIRSHTDNRVLASFPTKAEAEEQLKRMQQYNKRESKFDDNETDLSKLVKAYCLESSGEDAVPTKVAIIDEIPLDTNDGILYRFEFYDDNSVCGTTYAIVYDNGDVYFMQDWQSLDIVTPEDIEDHAWVYANEIISPRDVLNETVRENINTCESFETATSTIRDWYVQEYPYDSLGKEINPECTFNGAIEYMRSPDSDIYDYIGVGDSIVREHIFSKLAEIYSVDYDDIYYLWLDGVMSNNLSKKFNSKTTRKSKIMKKHIKNEAKKNKAILKSSGPAPDKTTDASARRHIEDLVAALGETTYFEEITYRWNSYVLATEWRTRIELAGHPNNRYDIAYRDSDGKYSINRLAVNPKTNRWELQWDKTTGSTSSWRVEDVIAFIKDTWDINSKQESRNMVKNESNDIKDFMSDVLADLVVVYHYGEDGATDLVDSYSSYVEQEYVDGVHMPSEVAKELAVMDENPYASESCKNESYAARKKFHNRQIKESLELIDTIIVPQWLWYAYESGDESNLEDDEIDTLHTFQNDYMDKYLADDGEEATFHSYNDVDNLGGVCYTVNVYSK